MSAIQRRILVLLAVAFLCAASLQATMVLKMGLGEMCDRAGKIFRGTVVDVSPGTIAVGGGELPTVTYLIEVTDPLKGLFASKDGKSYETIRMLAPVKGDNDGGVQRFSKLPDLPQLEVGGDYLLLASTPGVSGLSTTVGLGQGCFSISEKDETAVNELGNQGLYEGPVAYQTIADDIRAALGQ